MEWSKLIRIFAICSQPYERAFKAAPPTESSIAVVNKSLNIELPLTFVRFAQECPSYGTWFASIGEDYQSHMHVLTCNQIFREPQPGEPGARLPSWLVLIDQGFDGMCNCFDTTAFNPRTREYPIRLFTPFDGAIGEPVATFQEYVEGQLEFSIRGQPRKVRKTIDKILQE